MIERIQGIGLGADIPEIAVLFREAENRAVFQTDFLFHLIILQGIDSCLVMVQGDKEHAVFFAEECRAADGAQRQKDQGAGKG